MNKRQLRYYSLAFLKHDFKASITVFFVALPLCLGISLASKTPVYAGLMAGIIGGIVIGLISKSALSVSGPAAGLTTICAAAIASLGSLEVFFVAVAMAGILQILLGVFKLGGFTHFIPSSVIKGMLAAIGIILISKQIPFLIGYDKPDFYTDTLFNILTFNHAFDHLENLYESISKGVILVSGCSFLFMYLWQKYAASKIGFLPTSFLVVLAGSALSVLMAHIAPEFQLKPNQLVHVPDNVLADIRLPDFAEAIKHSGVWRTAVVVCFVATLETLLSIEAIDKLDPYHRITPQNRELVAQGTGNLLSGLLGGLPITAVIVRSSANAEAGARTKQSAISHGVLLFLVIVLGTAVINYIPYCVLAVILIRTGYNLAKPSLMKAVYHQGREQFLPFIITILAILTTDLLVGVLIGFVYAIYFLIKHTTRAGFTINHNQRGSIHYYDIVLTMNVSFLNKRKIMETLDKLPDYSVVSIDGTDSVYIDNDILEIFQEFRTKARIKHIELTMKEIPEVRITGGH